VLFGEISLVLFVCVVGMVGYYWVYCFGMDVLYLVFLFIVVATICLGHFWYDICCFPEGFLLSVSLGTFNFHQPPYLRRKVRKGE